MESASLYTLIYETLESDSTLRGLTGWTVGDPHIYNEFPEEDKLPDAADEAIVILALSIVERMDWVRMNHVQQLPFGSLEINIFSLSWSLVQQTYARIFTLLNGQELSNGDWRILSFALLFPWDDSPWLNATKDVIHRRLAVFRVGPIFSKTALVA